MKREKRDTINSLMGWKDNPGPYPSNLVECCEKACAKPLRDLSLSELQALLQSQIALPLVVERALVELEKNPLLYARHYEGDMMQTVLKLPGDFWRESPELWHCAYSLLEGFEAQVAEIGEASRVFRSSVGAKGACA